MLGSDGDDDQHVAHNDDDHHDGDNDGKDDDLGGVVLAGVAVRHGPVHR